MFSIMKYANYKQGAVECAWARHRSANLQMPRRTSSSWTSNVSWVAKLCLVLLSLMFGCEVHLLVFHDHSSQPTQPEF